MTKKDCRKLRSLTGLVSYFLFNSESSIFSSFFFSGLVTAALSLFSAAARTTIFKRARATGPAGLMAPYSPPPNSTFPLLNSHRALTSLVILNGPRRQPRSIWSCFCILLSVKVALRLSRNLSFFFSGTHLTFAAWLLAGGNKNNVRPFMLSRMHFILFHSSTDFVLDHAFVSGKHMEEKGGSESKRLLLHSLFHSISSSHTLFPPPPLSFSPIHTLDLSQWDIFYWRVSFYHFPLTLLSFTQSTPYARKVGVRYRRQKIKYLQERKRKRERERKGVRERDREREWNNVKVQRIKECEYGCLDERREKT